MKRNSLPYWITMLTVLLVFSACSSEKFTDTATDEAPDTKFSANVIYGTDGRLDLYQVTDDRLKAIADSTVALVKNSSLSNSGSVVTLLGKNYGTDMNLCSDEKFREQDTAAFCSGTLIGPDLILTAGHCIETASACQSTSFVFGFAVKSEGILPKTVSASEVYRCSEIIKTIRVNTGADFAVIRLDRAVPNHAPRAVRAEGDVTTDASLVVIGHPVGLPTKITSGGKVRSIANPDFFVADLDTYGGNSGSGVFNVSTGLLEGVLVRGEQDFTSRGSCVVSKVCAEGTCRGEDVTKISVIRPFIPRSSQPPVEPPVVNPPVDPPVLQPERFASNVRVSIPDNNKVGIASNLAVSSTPQGRKVIVSLNITHPYIGDLIVTLTAPDGKVATLHSRAGGSADNIAKSYEVTSSLGQVSKNGTYKLSVQDVAARDLGQLVNWSLEFK